MRIVSICDATSLQSQGVCMPLTKQQPHQNKSSSCYQTTTTTFFQIYCSELNPALFDCDGFWLFWSILITLDFDRFWSILVTLDFDDSRLLIFHRRTCSTIARTGSTYATTATNHTNILRIYMYVLLAAHLIFNAHDTTNRTLTTHYEHTKHTN